MVDSRDGIQETGANLDTEFIVSTIFSSQSEGNGDRYQNVAHSLKNRENLHKILERKVKLRQKLRREIGRRKFLTLFFKRPCKSLNLNDFSYIKQVDGQITLREIKISLYGELEFRNRFFQEDHARDCQEIEELRRICCKETDRARQARIGELSMHRERNLATVSQLLFSDLGITELSKFLVRCKSICTILNQGAALERPTFPIKPLLF